MSALQSDTIAALATPPGNSALAMFRVSGPSAFEICDSILKHRKRCSQYSGFTIHRAIVPDKLDTIDDVLVAVFHAPKSYTGENLVEITCHGGSVPIRRILQLLLSGGARHADPGEFTLRAFLNGKLDLAQAEAINDTINARTDESFRLAQSQQRGRLSAELNIERGILLGIVAQIEGSIDFPEDVGDFDYALAKSELERVLNDLGRLIRSAGRGMLYRDGISVVLAGKPNAGKSSLLNAMLKSDRAIVTAIPGTTRDEIEESMQIHGIPIRLIDTAGVRDTDDEVEKIGVERARRRTAVADIVVEVVDSTAIDYEESDERTAKTIVVWNKIDIAILECPEQAIPVSAKTGQGLDLLEDRIGQLATLGLDSQSKDSGEHATVIHARHLAVLTKAQEAVSRAQSTLADSMPLDFLSIEVQSALSAIGEITGQTAPQEIINEIFHRFCIGK